MDKTIMTASNAQCDQMLRERFRVLNNTDEDYWSFRGNSRREHGHAFFQYPAMMVPQMVSAVLREVKEVYPSTAWIGDPFAGSGTILTECMNKGLNFNGTDINPLAVLLCRTKAGPFYTKALFNKTEGLLCRIDSDKQTSIDIDFPGLNKWFRKDVQIGLSRIRRSILHERSKWARRFYWVALAEVVRITSNSRTSTFKLHIRPKNEISSRMIDPIRLYEKIVLNNYEHLKKHKDYLSSEGLLSKNSYIKDIFINLGDSRYSNNKSPSCDVIITSPPYGDNKTTVPYGQYSYLPLQWIDLKDIDRSLDQSILRTTLEIDTMSLGGRTTLLDNDLETLCDLSPSLTQCVEYLKQFPTDRIKRVVSFVRDLNQCIPPVLRGLKDGGVMIWTLGNRRVGGRAVPLDQILSELLSHHGTSLISSVTREIPTKRMALKNNIADTMSSERILIMRKAA